MADIFGNMNLGEKAKELSKQFNGTLRNLKKENEKGGSKKKRNIVIRRPAKVSNLEVLDVCSRYNLDQKIVVKNRDKEIGYVFDFLGKKKENNVLIVGKSGTGRKSVIYGMAEKIAHNTCPVPFKGYKVYELDCLQFAKKYDDPVEMELCVEALKALFVAYGSRVIVYLKNIETLYILGLIGYFKDIFEKYRFVGILDEDLVSELDFLTFGFNYLYVENPKPKEIYDSVSDRVNYLKKAHKVAMTREDFENIVSIVHMIYTEYNIGEILDITDESLSIARNRGLRKLNIKCILEPFRVNIDKFFSTKEDIIRLYASHEVGHAIVAINHSVEIEAISLIPTDTGAGGYNYFSQENSVYYKKDYSNYIDVLLGGYAGTLVEGFDLSIGAYEDIHVASEMARAMYLYIGFDENSAPISYINEKGEIAMEYMSDKMKDELAEKVNKIIGTAEKNAEKIIRDDKEKFDILVKALIKKGFLTKHEILDLYSRRISVDDLPSLKDLTF